MLATAMLKLYQHGPAMLERTHEFPALDDILPTLEKVGGTLIKSEEYLPTTSLVNDKQSLSRQELDQQRESRNRAQNRYWTWK